MDKLEILQEYKKTLDVDKIAKSLQVSEKKKGFMMQYEEARLVCQAIILKAQRRKI